MKLLTKTQTEEGKLYVTTYDMQEYCIQKLHDFRSHLLDPECVRGMILRGEIVLPQDGVAVDTDRQFWKQQEKKYDALLDDLERRYSESKKICDEIMENHKVFFGMMQVAAGIEMKNIEKKKPVSLFGDVPLKHAMLAWNGVWDARHDDRELKVVIIPHPDSAGSCDRLRLSNTCCACFCEWGNMSKLRRLYQLFMEAWYIVARDGVPQQMMHDALMVIPEYRETLSGERLFSHFIRPFACSPK